ncbi:MAG: nuclear transport factor 2 family protein [bacterium]|nr:nuclear transport factor 2 family protein [bacterium]
MTPEEMSEAIDAAWAAFSAGDLDGFVAGCAEDIVYSDNAGEEPLHGRDAFRRYASGWFEASSDRRATPLRKTIGGSRIVTEIRLEMTHDGAPLYGVAAAGARIAFDFAMIADFREGRIARIVAYYNPASVMRDLGLTSGAPADRPA